MWGAVTLRGFSILENSGGDNGETALKINLKIEPFVANSVVISYVNPPLSFLPTP